MLRRTHDSFSLGQLRHLLRKHGLLGGTTRSLSGVRGEEEADEGEPEGEFAEDMSVRFRTIGDMTCTGAVMSQAKTIEDIISEIYYKIY